MEGTVQAIFAKGFTAYAQARKLPPHYHQAAGNFIRCRTAALGGHKRECENGHIDGIWYNSCGHRSCPQCNQLQIERWLEKQQARLLGGAHRHLLFTIPHEFHTLWLLNSVLLMDLLFRAVRETLGVLTQEERYLGAEPGFLLGLHTWGRSRSLHPPIHCLLTEGMGSIAPGPGARRNGGVSSRGGW